MRIFPPYRKWIIPIKDPVEFKEFLENHIEHWNTNYNAPLKGKLDNCGFLVEIKDSLYNRQLPKIKGTISTKKDGNKELIIGIQSGKTLLFIVAVFSLIILISAIINASWLPLITIPVITVWFGFMAYILHIIGLDKTKKELKVIIDKAGK